jgi:hypothetical protein
MTVLAGPVGDRRGAELKPSPRRPVRLADHEELVRHVGDTGQERDTEASGAQEDDPPDASH